MLSENEVLVLTFERSVSLILPFDCIDTDCRAVAQGVISNILEENVVQPLLVSTSAIELATETVGLILRIDDYHPSQFIFSPLLCRRADTFTLQRDKWRIEMKE